MGKIGCFPCFSSKTRVPSSSNKGSTSPAADTSSSSNSEDRSNRGEEVPSCKLVPLPRRRAYPQHAVGIDDQVDRVIQLLEWENETKVAVAVILHGLGGTGKTTLADAVVARLDIQGWNCSTVVPLEGIGSNMTGGQGEMQGIPAFIYIDNYMIQGGDLQKLLPNDSCKKKLRLLLTARDEMVADVLSERGIHTHVYPVRPLLSQDAMEILRQKMGVPSTMPIPHHHSSQINEILQICDGVPLVLERVGAFICQSQDTDEAYRRVIEWSKDGKPFSSAEEYSIEKKGLLFDFDELPASAKETFLDICYFFNGWDWDEVSCIMGSEDELNSLLKRALLLKKEDCKNKVMVRHIILTIGRNMTKGTRFTSAHDLGKALEGNEQDIGGIKGIWLKDNVSEPLLISAKKLDLMHDSLRVLALGGMAIVVGVDGQYCMQKFKQVIYFQAELIPCIPFHPTTSQELRILDCILPYDNNDVQLNKISSKLKVLNLNGGRYDRTLEIESLFWRLQGLRTLKLADFNRLKNIPEELSLLTQLADLDLSGCKRLAQLPKGLGDLNSLSKLSLRSCGSLRELPDSFGKLRSLKYLDLHSCETLIQLPQDFGSLNSLEELDLGYCSNLQNLPISFRKLSSLKMLNLVCCNSLYHQHAAVGNLSALVRIQFEGSYLVSIPCRYLNLVKNLSSDWCSQLTNLPKRLIDLTNLRSLDLWEWTSLERLPEGFSQLKSLVKLNLGSCFSLQELSSDFHRLASLQILNLSWCWKLEGKWMDSVVKINTLELVDIMESRMLVERWAQMAQGESWRFSVRSTAYKRWNWESVESKLNKAASKLFTGETLLTDPRGQPFTLSTVPPNTVLLVAYDYDRRPNRSRDHMYYESWKLLEGVMKQEHPLPFQMIYVGKYFGELSKSFAERIMAYASDDSDAHLFFEKAFNVNAASCINGSKFLVTEVVADIEGRKHFSTWKQITKSSVDFFLSKSRLYPHLEQLAKAPQESNDMLLRALFETGESRTSSIFLRNYTEKMGVDALHGKTVLLFISVMEYHPFRYLKEIYSKVRTRDDMEIVSIPIPAEVRGQDPMPPDSDLVGFENILRNVPWPVLRNPWSLKTEVYYFFLRGVRKQAVLAVVEPNGRMCNKNALPLVKRWGAEVYPFAEEKMKQLEQASEEEKNQPDEQAYQEEIAKPRRRRK